MIYILKWLSKEYPQCYHLQTLGFCIVGQLKEALLKLITYSIYNFCIVGQLKPNVIPYKIYNFCIVGQLKCISFAKFAKWNDIEKQNQVCIFHGSGSLCSLL